MVIGHSYWFLPFMLIRIYFTVFYCFLLVITVFYCFLLFLLFLLVYGYKNILKIFVIFFIVNVNLFI